MGAALALGRFDADLFGATLCIQRLQVAQKGLLGQALAHQQGGAALLALRRHKGAACHHSCGTAP